MRKFLFLAVLLLLCAAPVTFGQSCTATFQTESLQLFHVGQHFNLQLEGVSGTPPYTFEVVEGLGDPLPPGFRLKSNGQLKGKPEAPGSFTVFIRLTDAAGCTVVQAFPVEIEP
jgi:hypothetical protein